VLISAEHRLVFIHIHKTAGTSIVAALAAATGAKKNVYKGAVVHNHARAREILRQFPETSDFFWFAIARNPWDRLVSYYHWARDQEPAPHAQAKARIEHLRRYASFGDYVSDLYETWRDGSRFKLFSMKPDPETGAVSYPAQHTWIYRGDRCLVNFVGRFESLDASLEHVRSTTAIPALAPLAHVYRTDRPKDYRCYYDSATAEMVRAVFARDIELFGYTYDPASTT
jgi:hypothetical protein